MSSTSSVSISQGISQATIGGGVPPGKITMGHGEYIVFHQSADGLTSEVSKETYEEVYAIFMRNSPAAIINNGGMVDDCLNRYETIKSQIKELDPTLEAVFVPRTLYELIFIRKCIEEDIEHKAVCEFVSSTLHASQRPEYAAMFAQFKEQYRTQRECWHLCYFDHAGDNEHREVKEMAFRLNKVMVDTLFPQNEGFTHEKISTHVAREIEFLKAQFNIGSDLLERSRKGEKVDLIRSCSNPGPTTNFRYELSKPMGIRNDADAKIITDAVALDCSTLAQKAFFLYRGASCLKDLPFCEKDETRASSISYGTSLFAGCVFDGGATAFHYMRSRPYAYAISIPFDQLHESPFFIPPTNAICQFAGDGEIFHGRSKAWAGFDLKQLDGMNCGGNGHKTEHLGSQLTREELLAQYDQYMSTAIQFK